MAKGIPPGKNRRFAFMDWINFDQPLWESIALEASKIETTQPVSISASDRDAGAIESAQANAQRAGVADVIDFSCQAVSAIEPQGKGWVVTNPPYGRRVSGKRDVRNLYAQFGNILRKKCPGWQFAFLGTEKHLINTTGLHLETARAAL